MRAFKHAVAASMLAILVQGCDPGGQTETETTTTDIAEASTASAAPVVQKLTEQQFHDAVVGKTMAEVKATLGSPQNVSDLGQGITGWYYWPANLQVYDPSAGIVLPGSSRVDFDAFTDHAVGVSFG